MESGAYNVQCTRIAAHAHAHHPHLLQVKFDTFPATWVVLGLVKKSETALCIHGEGSGGIDQAVECLKVNVEEDTVQYCGFRCSVHGATNKTIFVLLQWSGGCSSSRPGGVRAGCLSRDLAFAESYFTEVSVVLSLSRTDDFLSGASDPADGAGATSRKLRGALAARVKDEVEASLRLSIRTEFDVAYTNPGTTPYCTH